MNKISTLATGDGNNKGDSAPGATDIKINHDHVHLATMAAQGDTNARKTVNALVDNIIAFQTDRFCKRFCRENRYYYLCTLPKPWGSPPKDAPLCEWGNASYAWMLDDLTNANRLLQYKGKQGARLNDYIYHIANSLPFYERWKDWRFGRKVHVPTYIQDMGPDAGKVFLALRGGEAIANIAQRLGKSEMDTEVLCQHIVVCLTKRNRLHLLDPPNTVSLSTLNQNDEEVGGDSDIPFFDVDPEHQETNEKLWQVWKKLTAVEQFVLEAMLIDEQDANDVLSALIKLDISIVEGVPAAQTNRQQLYYFRRKSLAKLAQLMDEE